MSAYGIQGNKPDDLTSVITGLVAAKATEGLVEKQAEVAAKQDANLQAALTDERDNPLAGLAKKLDKQIKASPSTIKKAKEAKESRKKLIPVDEISGEAQKFKGNNPQFQSNAETLERLAKHELKEGMSFTEIRDLIRKIFPDPIQASLALNFLISISLDDYKEIMVAAQLTLNKEIFDKREEEVAKKIEAEAAQAVQASSAKAIKIIQEGDGTENLKKLLEHFMSNPVEASAIFRVLDDTYGQKGEENLKKIELYLLKACGKEVTKLKDLEAPEDKAHMKNAIRLLKGLQAIIYVDRYFEFRANKEERGVKRKAAA